MRITFHEVPIQEFGNLNEVGELNYDMMDQLNAIHWKHVKTAW